MCWTWVYPYLLTGTFPTPAGGAQLFVVPECTPGPGQWVYLPWCWACLIGRESEGSQRVCAEGLPGLPAPVVCTPYYFPAKP